MDHAKSSAAEVAELNVQLTAAMESRDQEMLMEALDKAEELGVEESELAAQATKLLEDLIEEEAAGAISERRSIEEGLISAQVAAELETDSFAKDVEAEATAAAARTAAAESARAKAAEDAANAGANEVAAAEAAAAKAAADVEADRQARAEADIEAVRAAEVAARLVAEEAARAEAEAAACAEADAILAETEAAEAAAAQAARRAAEAAKIPELRARMDAVEAALGAAMEAGDEEQVKLQLREAEALNAEGALLLEKPQVDSVTLASAQAVVARAMAFVEDKDMVTTEDAKQRFKEMCSVVGVGDNRDELPKAAFKDLVKMLMTESGQKELPSDKDLDAAFKLADADKSGLVDEVEFLALYRLVKTGQVGGLGKSGGLFGSSKKASFKRSFKEGTTAEEEPPSDASSPRSPPLSPSGLSFAACSMPAVCLQYACSVCDIPAVCL